jgi:hypothetical protein
MDTAKFELAPSNLGVYLVIAAIVIIAGLLAVSAL